jgi:hypothetical protein
MKNDAEDEPALSTAAPLPRPPRGSRWRWSTPRTALAAGGALAAVLALGASTAGAATSTAARPAGALRQPPSGAAHPAVIGKITAISGNDVTVQTQAKAQITVMVSSATTYRTLSGPNGSPSSAGESSLKVGDFIGVQGTRNSDGTVTATAVLTSTGPPPGAPAGPGKPGTSPPGSPPAA